MYIDLVDKLCGREAMMNNTSATFYNNNDLKPIHGLDIIIDDKIFWIKFDRPNKHNALTFEVCDGKF